MTTPVSPGKLLADAKNETGNRAVNASKMGDHSTAREWSALAAEVDRLLRNSVELMARG